MAIDGYEGILLNGKQISEDDLNEDGRHFFGCKITIDDVTFDITKRALREPAPSPGDVVVVLKIRNERYAYRGQPIKGIVDAYRATPRSLF